jgi:hypothetical protein
MDAGFGKVAGFVFFHDTGADISTFQTFSNDILLVSSVSSVLPTAPVDEVRSTK